VRNRSVTKGVVGRTVGKKEGRNKATATKCAAHVVTARRGSKNLAERTPSTEG